MKSSVKGVSLKILVIPDKFKGTLTSRAAAEAIGRGWGQARPQDELTLLPMSDGGDGFGEVMGRFSRARLQKVKTVDAAHRPLTALWWWEPNSKTAIIESARVIGLALLPPKRFHPFLLDTFGLGAVFQAAAKKGARRCIVGIGGSATNDGGFGLALAMGWKFLDASGSLIESWIDLDRLKTLCPPKNRLPFKEILVAVDVRNRLLGSRGATRVYGPQKGMRPADFKFAELCLGRLAKVWKRYSHLDLARVSGTGAAGGLGFGLKAFLKARLVPGFDLFAHHAGLERLIRASDLVITGEGAVDKSTLMGKGVGQLATACLKGNVPCIAIAGLICDRAKVARRFVQAHAITDLASANDAKSRADELLCKLATVVARKW